MAFQLGISGQLAAPAFVLDARRTPRSARYPRLPAGKDGVSSCVLLLSRSRDPELDGVQELLRQVGVPCARLDADELAATDVLLDPLGGRVRLNGRWLTPAVAWVRHFAAGAIPGRGPRAMFLRESWASAARQLVELSRAQLGTERPSLLAQLAAAARYEVAVPRTVITTDPRQAAREFSAPRLIVKATHRHFVEAEPGLLSGIFPVVVGRPELAASGVPGPPVVVQEYVDHDAELRVYRMDDELVCFEVGKTSPADPWLAPERVTARAVDPPPAVALATRQLAAGLGLRYGAFDFLIRGQDPVFLEVNPDGDWCWLETKVGTAPVTSAAAGLLCRLHRAAADLGPPGTRSFDLLAFLAG